MAWCFEDEASSYSEGVLDQLGSSWAAAPAIWSLEVANALLVAERQRRLSEAQMLHFVQFLLALPVTVDGQGLTGALGPVLALGREQVLSAYDAAYLELAARLGLPLASNDERLRRAATNIGVSILQ